MKKLFAMLAAPMALMMTFTSCKDDGLDDVEVGFSAKAYVMYEGANTVVTAVLSEPAKEPVSVSVAISGAAEKDKDYTMDKTSFDFAQGETEAVITVTAKQVDPQKQIILTILPPKGYTLGFNNVAVVTPVDQEALIYNFDCTENQLFESYQAKIEVTGSKSGKDWKAESDIVIPVKLGGASGDVFVNSMEVTIPAGGNSATFDMTAPKQVTEPGKEKFTLSVDTQNAPRLIPGDKSEVSISIWGQQNPDLLLGTWVFDKVWNLEELELWFEEMEDDPKLCPTHNAGFTLTFEKQADGSVTLTPGETAGKCDFSNFFKATDASGKKVTVKLAAPKNPCSGAVTLGSYSVKEGQMFMAAEADNSPYVCPTFYELSAANRKFSSESTDLAPSVVSFLLDDKGGLTLIFRDYDEPEFGIMWWDPEKFDSDIFGFASHFVKK